MQPTPAKILSAGPPDSARHLLDAVRLSDNGVGLRERATAVWTARRARTAIRCPSDGPPGSARHLLEAGEQCVAVSDRGLQGVEFGNVPPDAFEQVGRVMNRVLRPTAVRPIKARVQLYRNSPPARSSETFRQPPGDTEDRTSRGPDVKPVAPPRDRGFARWGSREVRRSSWPNLDWQPKGNAGHSPAVRIRRV